MLCQADNEAVAHLECELLAIKPVTNALRSFVFRPQS